jgi:hypothetical protein
VKQLIKHRARLIGSFGHRAPTDPRALQRDYFEEGHKELSRTVASQEAAHTLLVEVIRRTFEKKAALLER